MSNTNNLGGIKNLFSDIPSVKVQLSLHELSVLDSLVRGALYCSMHDILSKNLDEALKFDKIYIVMGQSQTISNGLGAWGQKIIKREKEENLTPSDDNLGEFDMNVFQLTMFLSYLKDNQDILNYLPKNIKERYINHSATILAKLQEAELKIKEKVVASKNPLVDAFMSVLKVSKANDITEVDTSVPVKLEEKQETPPEPEYEPKVETKAVEEVKPEKSQKLLVNIFQSKASA